MPETTFVLIMSWGAIKFIWSITALPKARLPMASSLNLLKQVAIKILCTGMQRDGIGLKTIAFNRQCIGTCLMANGGAILYRAWLN